ncbi:unnamed protein product [Penicillium olsonii]|nr:unnamed protein product [Penicillium olsonii]
MDSTEKRKFDEDAHGSSAPKQRKVIGPSLPPGPTPPDTEITGVPTPPDADAHGDTSSNSDDDFGPSLPPSNLLAGSTQCAPGVSSAMKAPEVTEKEPENQRDQWMLQPPSQSDWASKIDPTQLRNRKFNTGKSAHAPKKMDSSWVEAPEERMKRLQDAVMGVGTSTDQHRDQPSNAKAKEDQIKRYNVSHYQS